MTGSLYAGVGVLAALLERERTGHGRHVDISLVDSLASLISVEHLEVYEREGIETRTGNAHARLTPFGVYESNDGHVAIAAHTDEWIEALFTAIDRPDLSHDARFGSRGSRVRYAEALNAILEDWTRQNSSADIVRILHGRHGIPTVTVRRPHDSVSDPHLIERGAVVPLQHPYSREGDGPIMGTGLPIRFSGIDATTAQPAPRLGQHNTEIYGKLLELDADELNRLERDGVI